MVNAHRHQSGFSLVELLVVTAVVGIGSAVAIASWTRVASTANLRESFVDTAAAAKRSAAGALGGTAARFSVERDGRLGRGLTVNPKYIPAPPGTEPAGEVEFEGGTGNARVNGRRAVASIVLCEEGQREFACAIVCGTAGRVELRTYSNGQWSDFR